MKSLDITPEEGMLIDWVLTMHSYDSLRLEQLETVEMVALRKKVAAPIIGEKHLVIDFNENELSYLLISIPITFRFYKEDIGFSLKKKLLATLVPARIDWGLEVKNENNNASEDSSSDKTADSP